MRRAGLLCTMMPMNRREILKLGVAVSSVPVSAATPAAASQAEPAVKGIQQSAWKPLLFDDHQNETVVALTELIIPATDTPGAKAALVNRYIDLFLHDGPQEQREHFLAGLSWLDGYAMRKHQRPFVRCTPAQQSAILETLDRGKEEGVEPGARFFQMIKGLTSRIYYSTEIGFKELNKGGRVPSTFGCTHSGRH